MKRLAYVCADRGVPIFAEKGASIHVQETVRAFRADGIEIEIFARRTGGDPPADLAGVPVHRLPRSPRGAAEYKERADLESNGALPAVLDAAGPFDAIYERHSLWSFAGMEYARARDMPGLLEVNAPLLEEQRRYRQLVHEREAERAVSRAYAAASALLAVSRGVAEYLGGHAAVRGPVHVVPNGVDPRRFRPAPARPRPAGTLTVGFVGSLKPWHGVETLIEAFAELHRGHPRARLLIVGHGPQREALEALAARRTGTGAVSFHGPVSPAEVPALVASMDVAVAPYPPLERFYFSPLKVFEYMAAGRAVVAAGIGQLNEVIADGVNGVLYRPGDTAQLAAALARLALDRGLRERLGAAAREAAVARHSWRAVVCRVREIAGDAVAAPPGYQGVR